MKVFITRPIPNAYQSLINEGYEVGVYEKDEVCPKDILLSRIKGVDAVLTQWEDYVDTEFFEAAGKTLKIVASFAKGVARVDVKEAVKRGVIITNTPTDSLYSSTAEAAVSMLMSIAKRTTKLYVQTLQNNLPEYSPIGEMGLSIRGKVSGIVGLGNIGSKVAQMMHNGFNNKILYFGRENKDDLEKKLDAKKAGLDKLFAESDFIFITIPHNASTDQLIKSGTLRRMKAKAILISISPAEVLDNETLVKLVENGDIYGAGLDIYPIDVKPLNNHNLILTSHNANTEEDTTQEMAKICVTNILNVLGSKPPITEVTSN